MPKTARVCPGRPVVDLALYPQAARMPSTIHRTIQPGCESTTESDSEQTTAAMAEPIYSSRLSFVTGVVLVHRPRAFCRSNYAQELSLLHKYYGDARPMSRHYDSLKDYVEYARHVTACPACDTQVKTNTRAPDPPHLPYYGFSSDWLEWRPNAINLGSVGSESSSMHFILDLETLRDFAAILNKTTDAAKYTALSAAYRKQFNELYLTANTTTSMPMLGGYGGLGMAGTPVTQQQVQQRRSYCPSGSLQGKRAPRTCGTQAQQVIPLYPSSAPVGRFPPLVPPDASDEVFATLLDAIRCPITTDYDDCPLELASKDFLGPWASGLNLSASNQMAWLQCWESKGPNCNATPPGRINTGLVATAKILPMLSHHNRSELALALAMSTTFPSWGWIVEQGGTSLWETWSGKPFDGATRSCHNQHQDAGGLQWFHDFLVGFQAGETGTAFESFIVAPAITTSPELPAMRGSYDTPRGLVEVSWETSAGAFVLNVTAPPNTRAATRVPLRGVGGIHALRCMERDVVLWHATSGSHMHLSKLGTGIESVVAVDGGEALQVTHGSGLFALRVEY
jgi:hypothetical protein